MIKIITPDKKIDLKKSHYILIINKKGSTYLDTNHVVPGNLQFDDTEFEKLFDEDFFTRYWNYDGDNIESVFLNNQTKYFAKVVNIEIKDGYFKVYNCGELITNYLIEVDNKYYLKDVRLEEIENLNDIKVDIFKKMLNTAFNRKQREDIIFSASNNLSKEGKFKIIRELRK